MRKHRADIVIAFLTFLLMAFGLLIMFTIGPVRENFLNAAGGNFRSGYFFTNQVRAVILSTIAFFAIFKFLKYEQIKKFSKILVIGSLFLCLVLMIAQVTGLSIARCENGACRWFNIFGFSLQPADFLKLSLVVYLAELLADYKAGKYKKGGIFNKIKN